ncbi:peptidoglycan editing factor PgeF [Alteromonas sp. C1M14]|uniref:peptidoglycan editing factor PgeF n=1 Tax=Alteromonas sp. C1M14 TaxID=2841567 RepID=UPI001C09A053|nr:peptidoglycan editing factor PgeF [Alteromonas sp. C1M14]MBU2979045.1 peptidoglycan editing factor PgeF [Alteromonas sp. C1M14]
MAVLTPDWAVPENVFAYTTTRAGGGSSKAYASLNVGKHVGDCEQTVEENRRKLPYHEKLIWLNQVHGNRCVTLPTTEYDADGVISRDKGFACAIMTADCLPILLVNERGDEVAAIHAGWQGLVKGVIPNTLKQLLSAPDTLLAWIGPAISQQCYEVSGAVSEAFSRWPQAILPGATQGKFMLDLPAVAKAQLAQAGVKRVTLSGLCTYSNPALFFSHRRSSQCQQVPCGRQVSVIGFK